jgi:hypothetical protein
VPKLFAEHSLILRETSDNVRENMALFTTANAREMAAKANAVRWERYKAEQERQEQLRIARETSGIIEGLAEDDLRRRMVIRQIQLLDEDFEDAKPEMRIKIAQAKAKLWELVCPKAGVLRPSSKTPKKSRSPGSPESYSPPEPAE